ncbi:MAG TPA: DUF4159 domain-containing protein [Gemmatimonadales bacterium]|jgi:hypothetical protein|nr:DUF4159 domain-containing protein [Gemmatimonadales bacterium]
MRRIGLLRFEFWIGVALLVAPEALAAQRRWGGVMQLEPNVAYDGRFTFARIRYTVYGRSGWEYDYPTMERNLMTMMDEVTALRPHVAGSNIFGFDEPELLKYPVAYLSEPGYWIPNEREAAGLRTYLAKGGFLIVDDFRLDEWHNFERQILRALPWAHIKRLDVSHPIFNSFFRIESLNMSYPTPGWQWLKAEFFGIFEDNDPAKRLLVVINYNNDIGDYMEWSGTPGWWPVNITNDAYKLAINYIVYGLTR